MTFARPRLEMEHALLRKFFNAFKMLHFLSISRNLTVRSVVAKKEQMEEVVPVDLEFAVSVSRSQAENELRQS